MMNIKSMLNVKMDIKGSEDVHLIKMILDERLLPL
jgi:hypothetical protein